jgi:hypothetical protein
VILPSYDPCPTTEENLSLVSKRAATVSEDVSFEIRGQTVGLQLCDFTQACPTLCTSASSSIGVTWLFVVFATTHFLFDSSVLNELPKSLDRVLDFLPVSKSQLDHQTPLFN